MYCPQCGTQNAEDNLTCVRCGYDLQTARTATPSIPATQPSAARPSAPPETPPPFVSAVPVHYAPPVQAPTSPDNTLGGLIPYKNSSALIAYYLGIFSLIPGFGLFTGIAAFVLGLKGLRYAKEHPEAKGKVHAWIGIVCGGFWALVHIVAIVLIIVGIVSAASQ